MGRFQHNELLQVTTEAMLEKETQKIWVVIKILAQQRNKSISTATNESGGNPKRKLVALIC